MNPLTRCSQLGTAPSWLRVALGVVLGGWLADRLAVRLFVGSRADRREMVQLIKRLNDPVETAKVRAWHEANPILPSEYEDYPYDPDANARINALMDQMIEAGKWYRRRARWKAYAFAKAGRVARGSISGHP